MQKYVNLLFHGHFSILLQNHLTVTCFKYWDIDHVDLSHETCEVIFISKRQGQDNYTTTCRIALYITSFEEVEGVNTCIHRVNADLYDICLYDNLSKSLVSTIARCRKEQVLPVLYNFVKSKVGSDVTFFNSIEEIKKSCATQNKKFFYLLSKKYIV